VSLLGKISFPILSFFIFLFLLFHFLTPKTAVAKNFVAKNLTRIKVVETKIKNGIKNDFSKFKNLKLKNEKNFHRFLRRIG